MLKLCNGCFNAFRPQQLKRGRCPACLKTYYAERGKTRARGYGGTWQRLSRAVLRRDNHRCAYCGGHATTADHVIPKSKGGTDAMRNLVAACNPCNSGKRDREAGFLEARSADPFPGIREESSVIGSTMRNVGEVSGTSAEGA